MNRARLTASAAAGRRAYVQPWPAYDSHSSAAVVELVAARQ
ncbi:hypothetical protein AB0B85_32450 [Micromonospora sp. NPDC049044]